MPAAPNHDANAKECPLCGTTIAGGADGMNHHFTDGKAQCRWTDASKTPAELDHDRIVARGNHG